MEHRVVSHAEWEEARKKHLVQEKKFTKLRDELSQARRELPWELVDKSIDGEKTLRVYRASSEAEIRSLQAQDPLADAELTIESAQPWTVWLREDARLASVRNAPVMPLDRITSVVTDNDEDSGAFAALAATNTLLRTRVTGRTWVTGQQSLPTTG